MRKWKVLYADNTAGELFARGCEVNDKELESMISYDAAGVIDLIDWKEIK